MKATKGHVRTIDLLIAGVCGVKPGSLMRYLFSTFKGYNGYVLKKYNRLSLDQKKKLEKERKKIVARTAKIREKTATMHSRSRRGVK